MSALPELVAPGVVETFERYKVMSAREVQARYDVALESYSKTINVEGQLMVLVSNRYILPAALGYQTDVAQTVASVKQAGASSLAAEKTLTRLCELVDAARSQTDSLMHALEHGGGSPEEHARYFRDEVVPRMQALRETCDHLEVVMPSTRWPLPTYREMLFIK